MGIMPWTRRTKLTEGIFIVVYEPHNRYMLSNQ